MINAHIFDGVALTKFLYWIKNINKKKIVREIPLPPIALGKGPVPIYPKNTKVKNVLVSHHSKNQNEKERLWSGHSYPYPSNLKPSQCLLF